MTWQDKLSICGDIISIASFIITGFTFYLVLGLKKRFLSRARTPELISDISKNVTELSSLLNDVPSNKHKIIEELRLCRESLRSLHAKQPNDVKNDIDSIIRQIDLIHSFDADYNIESSSEDVRSRLVALIKQVEIIAHDMRFTS